MTGTLNSVARPSFSAAGRLPSHRCSSGPTSSSRSLRTSIQSAWLGRAGEQVTQSDLARFGEIHPMQVSQMLKMLEGKGLIARVVSESDRRAKYVKVTGPGLSALRRAQPLVLEVQLQFFGEQGRVGGSLLAELVKLDRRR